VEKREKRRNIVLGDEVTKRKTKLYKITNN